MIRFEHVTLRYPRTDAPALDDVSVSIERGEFVFVVGPSGSGKSSLLRLVTMERQPTVGSVLVAGRDLTTLPARRIPAHRRELGVVFQDFRLLADKTVSANVAYPLQVLGRGRREIRRLVPEVLELVGLEGKAKRMPHELSGGEQQRVAIARAMVNRPKILMADEPTGNLDPEISAETVGILERINRNGTTLVLATHDTSIVDTFRRRVVELDGGRLVRDEAVGEYVGVLP